MQPHPRYDIIEQIAVGDFATVFRARDKELNREVAIKQIHPQFLADQRQLERYWQEAQLLASLEHPNIMTIYDIDRSRGWLILELMTGSMRDRAAGQPMDLDFLRVGLVCSLQALKFLHTNGITHGDVKPSNLLIDRRNWVKLGDFGLAQRATNDQGSLFKGTTKYIAPERVSDQFGAVGPASDLYSLGFSIYELMCGEQFESLFPGLGAFGRDQQIAWMMWHAAPDRQAPEIGRVLEGVPEELQRVVERLIAKDPSARYATADEAIRDLKSGMGMGPAGPTDAELAAAAEAEEEAKKRKRRKLLLITAGISVLLCVGMMFVGPPEKPKPVVTLTPAEGVVKHLFSDKIVLVTGKEGSTRRTITLRENDQLYLNDVACEFAAFEEGDRMKVTIQKDDAKKSFQILLATRPQEDRGTITSVLTAQSSFVMNYRAQDGSERTVVVLVPEDVPFRFNGKDQSSDDPVKVTQLRAGDRIRLRHDAEDDHRVVLQMDVTRVVSATGTLRGIDAEQNTLTMTANIDGAMTTLTLPISGTCKVIINGREFVRDQPLEATDLRRGDKVTVDHDTHAVRIDAQRILSGAGVVQQTIPSRRVVEIQLDGEAAAKPFALAADAQVTLGDDIVTLDAIQPGDRVEVTYDAADPNNPAAQDIAATRQSDRNRWALVIGMQDYDDQALSPVRHLRGDAQLVYDMLVKRYRVAADQALLLDNVVRAEMKQQTTDFLNRVQAGNSLVVYFAGHAYVDANKTPFLTAKNFNLLHITDTGIPLSWLIEQVEGNAAAEKLIILDTCHQGSGADLRQQPSSTELIQLLETDRSHPALRTATVLTSCEAGQRAMIDGERGQFARAVADGYAGGADRNDDRRVDIPELHHFVSGALRTSSGGRQVPALVQPQEILPPRLSEDAKNALRRMAVALSDANVDMEAISELAAQVEAAAPEQPESHLLLGLAQLKSRQFAESFNTFRGIRGKHPKLLLPVEGMVWSLFQQRKYREAISGLVLLVARAPKELGTDGRLPLESRRILPWAGRLREFAATAPLQNYRPTEAAAEKVDEAAAQAGAAVQKLYRDGRYNVEQKVRAIDKRISTTTDKGERLKLEKFERPRLSNYVSFSIEAAAQQVLDGIDE